MWHLGIDLHRASAVIAAVDDSGRTIEPARIACPDTDASLGALDRLKPFRDELLARLGHFRKQIAAVDARLEGPRADFPQVESLLGLRGVGLYTALGVVAYAGLTAQVRQSVDRCRHGAITRECSPLLRWVLTEAAMKVIKEDVALRNFYTRIRKRSGARTAWVAVARKLAEICWTRLRRWHRQKVGAAAQAT